MTTPGLTISRILHAGYVFACEGTTIAFDTIFENPFSRNCHAFPDVRFDVEAIRRQRFDAVFISHFHDDHCSLDSLDLLDRATPLYIYCIFDELFDMVRQLGFAQVHQLRLNVPVAVGPITVTPREAMDVDVDSMFQVQAAGQNVLNGSTTIRWPSWSRRGRGTWCCGRSRPCARSRCSRQCALLPRRRRCRPNG
jgi:L-ascorbate metabolism protein UlaG (beta-lactamase superfamily)